MKSEDLKQHFATMSKAEHLLFLEELEDGRDSDLRDVYKSLIASHPEMAYTLVYTLTKEMNIVKQRYLKVCRMIDVVQQPTNTWRLIAAAIVVAGFYLHLTM